jgi:hypothetical protein
LVLWTEGEEVSAILPRLESCVIKAILQDSTENTTEALSFAVLTGATNVTIKNHGLLYDADFGSFSLNFYGGASQDEQQFPCVNVWAVDAQGYDAATPWIKRVTLNIALRYPADNSTEVTNVPAAINGVSLWLDNLTSYRRLLMDLVERSDNKLSISYFGPTNCSRGVDGDKRTTYMLWTMEVVCALNP